MGGGVTAAPLSSSAIERDDLSASRPEEGIPGNHWVGGWVGLKIRPGDGRAQSISFQHRESKSSHPDLSPPLYLLSYAALRKFIYLHYFIILYLIILNILKPEFEVHKISLILLGISTGHFSPIYNAGTSVSWQDTLTLQASVSEKHKRTKLRGLSPLCLPAKLVLTFVD
jgi:hypothetical protein